MPLITGTSTVVPPGPLTAEADPVLARVALTLHWPGASTAVISRVSADGTVTPVRGAEPATVAGGVWTGWDYEAPQDVLIRYQAAAGSITQSSDSLVLPSFGRTWLKHAGHPVLNQPVNVSRVAPLQRASRSAALAILDRPNPIVLSQQRGALTGSVEVWTDTDEARDGMWDLLADGTPLLFSPPGGTGAATVWVAVGDVTEARVTDMAYDQGRLWQLPVTVVDRPVDVVVTAVFDWAAVVDKYADWAAEIADNPSGWEELIANSATDPTTPAP